MKVTLSENNTQLFSIDYKAHEPHTGITVSGALECLNTIFPKIPNADVVKAAFIDQGDRLDNIRGEKYIADVGNDVWRIDVETPLCKLCNQTEVDNKGDLCSVCVIK